jgi:hypothetical protein
MVRERGAQLLGQGAQRTLPRRQTVHLAPTALLDRFDERRIAVFDPQKLCVRLRSVFVSSLK